MLWVTTVVAVILNNLKICLAVLHACNQGDLVLYNVVFETNWTRALFPKQYPEWRPPAQWSKVVGMSHDGDFRLFQLGTEASPQLKTFAETGKQEFLGELNNTGHVLDEFLMPNLKNGSGIAKGNFFADQQHSWVSLVARIIPSPDWFVGVDSIHLCADGHWVDSLTIEASPIDAGTDNGFTFTAPNWATEPQEKIYKITSQYPRHPANSFYYPDLQDLPAIAKFHITKRRMYRSIETVVKNNVITTESNATVNITSTTAPVIDLSVDQHQNLALKKKMKRKARKKKRSKSQKYDKSCVVGEWSDWSACNGPCGQSIRTRNITKPGKNCLPLIQERTCGCTKYIFNW